MRASAEHKAVDVATSWNHELRATATLPIGIESAARRYRGVTSAATLARFERGGHWHA
jgi:hypothetical protein